MSPSNFKRNYLDSFFGFLITQQIKPVEKTTKCYTIEYMVFGWFLSIKYYYTAFAAHAIQFSNPYYGTSVLLYGNRNINRSQCFGSNRKFDRKYAVEVD